MASLPKAAAASIEPLLSSALEKLATAQPASDEAAAFLACAAAHSAGLIIQKGTASSDFCAQVGFPFASHALSTFARASARTEAPIKSLGSSSARQAAGYLTQQKVNELEALMDSALCALAAQVPTLQAEPATDDEWRTLAASALATSAGLRVASTSASGQCDVSVQAQAPAFVSHAPM